MGKSNRIRNDRANDVLFGGPAPKKKKGVPSWALNAITIAGAVILLAAVGLLAACSNGVFGRINTVMKTDNFRVTENMMNYYVQAQYNSFKNENESYLSAYGLNTDLPLEEQAYSTDADGNVTMTWRDVMVNSTVEQVKEILVYCEAARAAGFELDDEAKQAIETELSIYEMYATYNGTTADDIVSAQYGKGIKVKDVRAALELSTLATKYQEKISNDIYNAISREEIEAEYNANKLEYDLVDYYKYEFKVTIEDAREAVQATLEEDKTATEAQVLAKYKEMITEQEAKAEELAKITDKEALRAKIIELLAEDSLDSDYKTAMKNVDADKLPAAEVVVEIRAELLAKVIAAVKDDSEFVVKSVEATETTAAKEGIASTGKSEDGTTTTYTVLGKDVSEQYYEAFVGFAEKYYTSVKKAAESAVVEGANYDESDEALKWMFGDEADAGEFKNIPSGDKKDEVDEKGEAKLKSSSIAVYYLTKDVYPDEDVSKNLGIIKFSSKEMAQTAANRIKDMGEITLEKLEALANELGGEYINYENCAEGVETVEAFNAWVFADGRTVGNYTSAEEIIEIPTSDSTTGTTMYSYLTMWYYGDGLKDYQMAAKDAVYSDKYTENDKTFKDTYKVSEPNQKLIDKISL